jgi:urease accessory protein UreE
MKNNELATYKMELDLQIELLKKAIARAKKDGGKVVSVDLGTAELLVEHNNLVVGENSDCS